MSRMDLTSAIDEPDFNDPEERGVDPDAAHDRDATED